ncbi:MAG: hypothetical protein MZV64_49295 [Ignavibacteriales bacterium]|nr:hypothetical protein [Ignavibacteriales bacterium]
MDIVIADANHSGDYYLHRERAGRRLRALRPGPIDQRRRRLPRSPPPRRHPRPRQRRSDQGVIGGSNAGLDGRDPLLQQRRPETGRPTRPSPAAGHRQPARTWPGTISSNFGADLRWKIVLTAEEDADGGFRARLVRDALRRRPPDRVRLRRTARILPGLGRGHHRHRERHRQEARHRPRPSSSPAGEGQLRAYDVTGVSFVAGADLRAPDDLQLGPRRRHGPEPGHRGRDLSGTPGSCSTTGTPTTGRSTRPSGRAARPRPWPAGTSSGRTPGTRPPPEPWPGTSRTSTTTTPGSSTSSAAPNRYWKLGDINHSTPVVVGPPAEDSAYMGDRLRGVQGSPRRAAEGRLRRGQRRHAPLLRRRPRARSSGASSPTTSSPKLKNMYAVGRRRTAPAIYVHDVYVDGTPAVADVQISGAWRTVLVCGQGRGLRQPSAAGARSLNYYWALDVTDPANPQPLWEITHTWTDRNRTYRPWARPGRRRPSARSNHGGTARWVAFMGSGYDNDARSFDLAGRNFYVVRDRHRRAHRRTRSRRLAGQYGQLHRRARGLSAIRTSSATIRGLADGHRPRPGRLHRTPSTSATSTAGSIAWTSTEHEPDAAGRLQAIYTDYLYYPIVTKPAVWTDPLEGGPARARVYFGTGGDDARSPTPTEGLLLRRPHRQRRQRRPPWNGTWASRPCSTRTPPTNGAICGTGTARSGPTRSSPTRSSISALCRGSIEAVNPCSNLGEAGRLYARYHSLYLGHPRRRDRLQDDRGDPARIPRPHQQGPPGRDRRRGRAGRRPRQQARDLRPGIRLHPGEAGAAASALSCRHQVLAGDLQDHLVSVTGPSVRRV